jgi:hypothetical protein
MDLSSGVVKTAPRRKRGNLITAQTMSKTGGRGERVEAAVNGILASIDDLIVTSPKSWGRNTVEYSLPEGFELDGMDPKMQQTLVYSGVIENLKSRGFDVGLLFGDRTKLLIGWLVDLSSSEHEAMRGVLAAVLITREQVPAFYKGELLNAPASATLGDGSAPVVLDEGRETLPRGGTAPRATSAQTENNAQIMDDILARVSS